MGKVDTISNEHSTAWGFDLNERLSAQRAAFNAAPYPSYAQRADQIKRLGAAIKAHEDDFIKAISEDFGNRAAVETVIAETMIIANGVKHTLKHLRKWMGVRRAPTALMFMPGRNKIVPQPKGVIGIISPWNYPLQLAIMPLLGVLAAGNRAMIKPSEYTPRLSALMKSVLSEIFSDDEVFVATGGVDVASAFSALQFDHLIFTGSTPVGRIVAQEAAKNLVPVTLELGGKSPTLIDESANLDLAIPRIVNAKLLNAGQTCVAPDYLILPKARTAEISDRLIETAERFYPKFAGNDDYTSIVADKHYSRLQDLLEDAENKGATIRVAGDDDKQQLAKERRVPLTVVTNVTDDMKIMQEEIFGPLLPIMNAESQEESLEYIQSRDRPLALYWFGQDKAKRDHILRTTHSGGVSINDAAWHVVQEDLPFGGIGPSGMGAYHGRHGFEAASHMKGVFEQSRFSGGKMLHPPYGPKTQKLIGLMKKLG